MVRSLDLEGIRWPVLIQPDWEEQLRLTDTVERMLPGLGTGARGR
jgi:hypothetical protein